MMLTLTKGELELIENVAKEHRVSKQVAEEALILFKQAYGLFERILNKLKEIIYKVVSCFLECVKEVVDYFTNNAPVGYKRLFKMHKLKYYDSVSKGKSNNWRKRKGLPLIRKPALT